MNILLIFSGIAVAVAAMLGIFAHSRSGAIWFTWGGVVLAITAAFVWFQDTVKPTGLKIVIALTWINEEKDLIASADGATIVLFNDSPSVLKDIHQILRLPTLKSAEVLDKYKSRASISGGGKPGSDYMVIEVPELPPTQRVILQVAFAEKQKVTSVEAWASQYGYAKDYIQVQQGFMGKERHAKP